MDYFFQTGALFTQLLGTLRIIPYIGLFKLTIDFSQLFALAVIVKDTPSTHRYAPEGP